MTETLLVLTEQSYILKAYCCFETENVAIFKVHLTPKIVFRSIESTYYSKNLGAKIFEFA